MDDHSNVHYAIRNIWELLGRFYGQCLVSIHIHYWTATTWYIYLIIQPYYATHGKLKLHRTNGIIGIFFAGGVCLTALSMLYRDINFAHLIQENPGMLGQARPWYLYGIAVVEFVMMIAFMYAVVKSIIHRKELENHAWWLISTVFIIMMPAVVRGVFFVWSLIVGFNNVNNMSVLYMTSFIIIALGLMTAWKYRKLKHPATYLILGVNFFNCLVGIIGRNETIQILLENIIKE